MSAVKNTTSPSGCFQTAKLAVVEMTTYFDTEFKKRGVWEESSPESPQVVAGFSHGGVTFEAYAKTADAKMYGFNLAIVFRISGDSYVCFEWYMRNARDRRSKSKCLSQEILSWDSTLDLLSDFLKGKFTTDRKSRNALLKELAAKNN